MKGLLLVGLLAGPLLFIAGSTLLIGVLTPETGTTLIAGLGGLVLILVGIAAFGLGLAESMDGAARRFE